MTKAVIPNEAIPPVIPNEAKRSEESEPSAIRLLYTGSLCRFLAALGMTMTKAVIPNGAKRSEESETSAIPPVIYSLIMPIPRYARNDRTRDFPLHSE